MRRVFASIAFASIAYSSKLMWAKHKRAAVCKLCLAPFYVAMVAKGRDAQTSRRLLLYRLPPVCEGTKWKRWCEAERGDSDNEEHGKEVVRSRKAVSAIHSAVSHRFSMTVITMDNSHLFSGLLREVVRSRTEVAD